jgi:[ribosomal protein S5]-alanine N-acetyltransferase
VQVVPESGTDSAMSDEPEFPVLTTPNLRLRRITPEDSRAVLGLFSEPAVVEYYDLPTFRELAEAERLVSSWSERWVARAGIRWAITRAASGGFIGTCGFNAWSAAMKNATIGYDLIPDAWGRGYASEAIRAMVAAAFRGALPCGAVHRIQADVMPENARSRRVLERLGFQLEGVRRGAGFWKGRHHDLACYSLLPTDAHNHG